MLNILIRIYKRLILRYPVKVQLDNADCGIACIYMIYANYKVDISYHEIKQDIFCNKFGTGVTDINEYFISNGFQSKIEVYSIAELKQNFSAPLILHWNRDHFVVLYNIKSDKKGRSRFIIADPNYGLCSLSESEFVENWKYRQQYGIVIDVKYNRNVEQRKSSREVFSGNDWSAFLRNSLYDNKQIIGKLIGFTVLSAAFAWVIPFVVQKVVDDSISRRSLSHIGAILVGQVFIIVGLLVSEVLRSVNTLKFSINVSTGIINKYLRSLLSLPISKIENQNYSSISQRIEDHRRVEYFLTTSLISGSQNLLLFFFYLIALFYYSTGIALFVIVMALVSILWANYQNKKRKYLDYQFYKLYTKNRNSVFDIVIGIVDIKINHAKEYFLSRNISVREKLNALQQRSLVIGQTQSIGLNIISQLKYLVFVFVCAQQLMTDKMTLGEMMSISFVLGSLNAPMEGFAELIKSVTDAKLAYARINEVELIKGIKKDNLQFSSVSGSFLISFKNVSFCYDNNPKVEVLRNVNMDFDSGKFIAIVGESGSGKSTLIKLLLAMYEPTKGSIEYNGAVVNSFDQDSWRSAFGVVPQAGYIFSGTLRDNIVLGQEVDEMLVSQISEICCIDDFLQNLPDGMDTVLGQEGVELSGGQKQRVLIARALYKKPVILIFDEATSALDSITESRILSNIKRYFKQKTIIVIAHRLNTVLSADIIYTVVKGEVVEEGSHDSLASQRGHYFKLVKNQLELGA